MMERAQGPRPGRWQPAVGWGALLLAWAAVWMVALGVVEARWVYDSLPFLYAAQLGALLAMFLAHTRISGRWAALVVGFAGALYVGEQVGHFVSPMFDADWAESWVRWVTLARRLADWVNALVNAEGAENPVVFSLWGGLFLWGSSAWALWGILRQRQPILAMAPLGGCLALSAFFNGGQMGYVVGFVACITLALPLVHWHRQERWWTRTGIDYPEIEVDVWQMALLVTLAVVSLAVLTPSFSLPQVADRIWQWIGQPWMAAERFLERFLGGVRPPALPERPVALRGETPGRVLEPSLPRAHLLGGDPELSQRLALVVCTDAPPVMPDQREDQSVSLWQTYWREITYDTFYGRHWANRASMVDAVPAYEPLLDLSWTYTRTLRQRYLIQARQGQSILAAGEPVVVDQPVQRRLRAADDMVALEGELDEYVVQSQVPYVSARQLSLAPASYPDRIVALYLQVPAELPERVRLLAAEITRDIDAPYPRAVAIERYLRQFPYDLRVPPPPPRQDVVDYFLFEAQRGYCDYYASSFVVLARLAGLPARLAVGYVMGEYDPERGCYRVTQMDAHSWPEVYMSGYGWISFEPTAAFRPFERAQVDDSRPQLRIDTPPVPSRSWDVVVREAWRRARRGSVVYVAFLAAIALLAALVAWGVSRRRWRRLSPVEGIADCYRAMARVGGWLGVPHRLDHTPAEYGMALSAAAGGRVARWPWFAAWLPGHVPDTRGPILALASAYEQASYGVRRPDSAAKRQIGRLWPGLRWRLWWLWVASRKPTKEMGSRV